MIPWLDPTSLDFPSPSTALDDPDGLLAAGGDLSPERLISAYRQGIFPWFSDDQPILWWSPDPRCVIEPNKVHISRSLKKHLRRHDLRLSFDQAFDQVIQHCSRPGYEEGTWITDDMKEAYRHLHDLGYAHSVEVWQDNELAGGLYGLSLGRCFFGESMFSHRENASKIAFMGLCRQLQLWNFSLIDCQIENPHLLSLGAHCISRVEFLSILERDAHSNQAGRREWFFDPDILTLTAQV